MEQKNKIGQFIAEEYSKLKSYIRSYARDLADMEPEDIIHEVLIKLLERPESIVPMENPAGYIYRAVRNRVIDLFRARKKQELSLDATIEKFDSDELKLLDIMEDYTYNPQSLLENKESLEDLDKAWLVLNKQEKELILGRLWDGLTYAELSDFWDIPQGTLMARYKRALDKLKKNLNGKGERNYVQSFS